MTLPLSGPGTLLIAALWPDPGKRRLIAAVSAGTPLRHSARVRGWAVWWTHLCDYRSVRVPGHAGRVAERRAWLDSLPERVDQQCRAWRLLLDGDPWHGSNALVLPVRRGGEQFALRLTAPDESFPAEVAALRF